MNSPSALPAELSFLRNLLGDRRVEYQSAYWLEVPFEADVWQNRLVFDIDFRIQLYDGTLLTNTRNRSLLEVFKTWLCVQSHPDCSGGVRLSDVSIRERVRQTLRLIDYFLLNGEQFQLTKYGFEAVTESDIRGLVHQLAESSSVLESIYGWTRRLETFLRSNSRALNENTLAGLLASHPMLREHIPPPEDRLLGFSDDEIIRARAWLWQVNCYAKHNNLRDYRYSPKMLVLAERILRDTLGGKHNKQVPIELCLDPLQRYTCEYPAVPVKSESQGRMSEHVHGTYIAALRRLGLLDQIGLKVPTVALRGATIIDRDSLGLKQSGRYRTLPQNLVFSSLRNGIEFSLRYGDSLISTYLNIMREALRSGVDCRSLCKQGIAASLLSPELIHLGVSHWTVHDVCCGDVFDQDGRHSYFRLVRSNVGIFELLRVLYGSIQISVGSLMARRQGELIDLKANSCLDKSRTQLIFLNEKSGIGGMNEKEARPIPRIAARLIKLIEDLQAGLISIGALDDFQSLFAYPAFNGVGLVGLRSTQYNETLDYFCDYFETPINSCGQRYYVRQHQLRRFVAMLFFWGRAFGGLDTIRWFLGHTDMAHVYRYITESTPGEVLRSVKAAYAADRVQAHDQDTSELATLLERHFGTRAFSVLDNDELTEYIEELIVNGQVEIEPEFLESSGGSNYRILIVVTPTGGLQ